MIAAWMLFAIVTGVFFSFAALAAARAASAVRQPTRMIWSAALLAAALWPVRASGSVSFSISQILVRLHWRKM